MQRRFNAALRRRGILKSDAKYYISTAHTADDIVQTIEAWESAIEELLAGT
jgi:glutamate-1-semialdehyde aminotransferase